MHNWFFKMVLFAISILVFIINVPFGYWRGGSKRYSVNWFIAIHAPVVISIMLRYVFNIKFQWIYLLLFASVFFAGQLVGQKIFSAIKAKSK